MKIYLIRHGETTGDIEDRFGGDYDDHLTEKGQKQALELTQNLKDKGIEKIFTSPLIRAKETSDTLQKALGVEVEVVETLRERNQYGVLTGMVKAEAKDKHPELVEGLRDFHNTIEGAENYEDFKVRILETLNNISGQDLSCVAIVTHGGPIKTILRIILNQENIADIKDCGFGLIEGSNNNYKMLDSENLYKS